MMETNSSFESESETLMAIPAVPSVSVIVPNYNHAPFLRARLDSILAQSWQDLEVILLDDASTDGSQEIIAEYARDPRVYCQYAEENSGSPFVQWRKGLALAKGRYIWIAESDDFAEPDFLTSLKSLLDARPNLGLAYSQSQQVDGEGNLLGRYAGYTVFRDRQRWTRDYTNSGQDELQGYMAFQNTIPNASAVLIRRELLTKDVLPPPKMRLAGDWYLWSALLLKSDIAYLARPLNVFRVGHADSQRSRTSSEGLDFLEGLEVFQRVDPHLEWQPGRRERVLRHRMSRWLILAAKLGYSHQANREISNCFAQALAAGPGSQFFLHTWNWLLSHSLIQLASTSIFQATGGRLIEWVRQRRRMKLMQEPSASN